MSKVFVRRLSDALHGVAPGGSARREKLITHGRRIETPPSYSLRRVLERLPGGPPVFGVGDKSAWVARLSFAGNEWVLEDWRRQSWTLYGPPTAADSAKELLRKIAAAATLLDCEFQRTAKEALATD